MTIQRNQLARISAEPDVIRALEDALNGILPGGVGVRFKVSLESTTGGNTATLGNSPVSGNPSKWIKIIEGGVIRYVPVWGG